MTREKLGMWLSWVTILMRWDSAQVHSWVWVCGRLTIGGASSLLSLMSGLPICIGGIGWGDASSLSMMARPVWGARWVALEGKMGWAWIVRSHVWIGSLSRLELFSIVGGGRCGCWGICSPRRIWRSDLMAWSLSRAPSWMPSMLKWVSGLPWGCNQWL